jgi:hypothetical protein
MSGLSFSLTTLTEENPRIRVITSFLGVGIMGLSPTQLPLDRAHLINPGQSVTVGDRLLTAIKPPTFDNPITTGFLDNGTDALFSSDCFGAVLPEVPDNAADLGMAELRSGQIRWTSIDHRGCTTPLAPSSGASSTDSDSRAVNGFQQPPATRPGSDARRLRRVPGHDT